MSYERDYSSALAKMLDVSKRRLVDSGLNETLATELSVDICEAITEEFCGQLFYVPMQFQQKLSGRNRDIYRRHEQGADINKLCAEFKLSHPRLYEILRKEDALVKAEMQGELF
jgi:Mor family transcriptional regulator